MKRRRKAKSDAGEGGQLSRPSWTWNYFELHERFRSRCPKQLSQSRTPHTCRYTFKTLISAIGTTCSTACLSAAQSYMKANAVRYFTWTPHLLLVRLRLSALHRNLERTTNQQPKQETDSLPPSGDREYSPLKSQHLKSEPLPCCVN